MCTLRTTREGCVGRWRAQSRCTQKNSIPNNNKEFVIYYFICYLLFQYLVIFSATRYSHSILDVTKASFIIRDKSCFLYHLVRTPRDGQERPSRRRSGPVPSPQPGQHLSAWGLLTSLNFSFLARCTEHCKRHNHETFPTRNLIQSASGSGRVCYVVLLLIIRNVIYYFRILLFVL